MPAIGFKLDIWEYMIFMNLTNNAFKAYLETPKCPKNRDPSYLILKSTKFWAKSWLFFIILIKIEKLLSKIVGLVWNFCFCRPICQVSSRKTDLKWSKSIRILTLRGFQSIVWHTKLVLPPRSYSFKKSIFKEKILTSWLPIYRSTPEHMATLC